MSARWGNLRRIAIATGLAAAALLLAAGEARAGFYPVAQCGWGAGADADWWDSTGGAKFRPSSLCAGGGGDHLKSFTRDGQGTVTGTRFARWRWVAPPTTSIRAIRGTWWQALHDGFEQRLGGATVAGGFSPFLTAGGTNTNQREFSNVFTPSVPAVEDRLLCARGDNKWCALDPGSWSGLRAVTLTIDDGVPPGAWITGGDLTDGGWRRGSQFVSFAGYDAGSGVHYGETTIDGARVGRADHPCAAAWIEGEWRATRMRPCNNDVWGTLTIDTTRFSDGPHTLGHCETDFAGVSACAPSRTVHIDNNPPASPRQLTLLGGDGWRRANNFGVDWANPDQGPASPIGGASWRLWGPAGFDGGHKLAAGRNRTSLRDVSVPAPGIYALQVWLRDEAGNEAHSSAVAVPLRYDDVRPGVAFAAAPDGEVPQFVKAEVVDAHSRPVAGALFYRRSDAEKWTELHAKLHPGNAPEVAHLVAPLPELAPGTYVFRADAKDGAGNSTSTTRRADGTEMTVRKVPPPPVAAAKPAASGGSKATAAPGRAPARAKTRLFARLRGGHGRGEELTVPFGAPAILSGRLTRADGAGIAARKLRVVARPSRGALAPVAVAEVETGERGGFQLRLGPGPSRRIGVYFAGDGGLDRSSRRALELRVRAGVSLRARPLSLRTGQIVRLSGRVRGRGAAVPRRGKLIAVQYLEAATGRWRPVLVTRTDHGGRFRARYRFRYVEGRAAIRLRATALPEERWPYAEGSSPPVTVRVAG